MDPVDIAVVVILGFFAAVVVRYPYRWMMSGLMRAGQTSSVNAHLEFEEGFTAVLFGSFTVFWILFFFPLFLSTNGGIPFTELEAFGSRSTLWPSSWEQVPEMVMAFLAYYTGAFFLLQFEDAWLPTR